MLTHHNYEILLYIVTCEENVRILTNATRKKKTLGDIRRQRHKENRLLLLACGGGGEKVTRRWWRSEKTSTLLYWRFVCFHQTNKMSVRLKKLSIKRGNFLYVLRPTAAMSSILTKKSSFFDFVSFFSSSRPRSSVNCLSDIIPLWPAVRPSSSRRSMTKAH